MKKIKREINKKNCYSNNFSIYLFPKIFHNKKAQDATSLANKQVYFLFVLFFIGLVMGVLVYIILDLNSTYVPEGLQQKLHVSRFINNCFVYVDPITNRKIPGIIDLSKFDQETFDNCYLFNEDTRSLSYRLTLTQRGSEQELLMVRSTNFLRTNRREVSPVLISNNSRVLNGELRVDYGE